MLKIDSRCSTKLGLAFASLEVICFSFNEELNDKFRNNFNSHVQKAETPL